MSREEVQVCAFLPAPQVALVAAACAADPPPPTCTGGGGAGELDHDLLMQLHLNTHVYRNESHFPALDTCVYPRGEASRAGGGEGGVLVIEVDDQP